MGETDAAFALLLLLCAEAARGGSPPAAVPPAPAVDDWDRFLGLVGRHRVYGLVHSVLRRAPGLAPEEVRRAVERRAGAQARHNLAMAAETARLQQLFDAAGIEAIFFKGAPLGQRAYGSLAVKHGKDIDFLIPPEALGPLLALVMREGYRPVLPPPPLTSSTIDALRAMHMEAVLVDAVRGVHLEPHWRLTENRRLLPLAPLRAAAGTYETLAGVGLRVFHPDDEFAYLCVHGARSGWFRLKWLADLHALVAGVPEAELLRLYRHAESRRAGPSAVLAFGLCRDLFGLALPAQIAALSETARQRAMRRLCRSNLDDEAPRFAVRRVFLLPLLHASAYGAGAVAAELLRWSVNFQDALDVPLPRHLHFLYPLLRLPLALGRRLRGNPHRRVVVD
ncbi:nucleotidyltransferase domain-containing protein [Ancylobacter sp.]|uniref:nucleotidyltransferase domain-containing protein n=1 Tax=Ancylobacter sp. TaxID=1872567 RepID=UPI003D0C08E9